MDTLYWFCPENDIALAKNCRRFTPPRQAALLARHGAPLMWWMGNEHDCVLLPKGLSDEDAARLDSWHRLMAARFGAGPRFVTSLADVNPGCLMPWGWSSYTVQTLLDRGMNRAAIAGVDAGIELLRNLSHRRSATEVNRRLAEAVDFGRYGMPVPVGAEEATTIDDVARFAAENASFYVKSPWSSSGRGVVCSDNVARDVLFERCRGIIASQGAVMLEPAYDKVDDFAMLFRSDGAGRVCFHGLSWFSTAGSAYTGNLLLPDSGIEALLGEKLPVGLIRGVEDALETILSEMIGACYRGYVGIDMMIARDGKGGFLFVPCVEMNLRMTMGVVAHCVCGRLGAEWHGRVMRTVPAARGGEMALHLVPENSCFAIGVAAT